MALCLATWNFLNFLPGRERALNSSDLQALPRACRSLRTASWMALFLHCSAMSSVCTPSDTARALSCLGRGTTKHTTKVWQLSAYTHKASTYWLCASAASTLPRDTYSPICSFTRSFLRSGWEKKQWNENFSLKFFKFVFCHQILIPHLWFSDIHQDGTLRYHQYGTIAYRLCLLWSLQPFSLDFWSSHGSQLDRQ